MGLVLLTTVLLQAAPAPSTPVLRLDDAVSAALAHQPTVRQAHAQTNAAEARADEAKAPSFPQLTGIASYQRVRSAGGFGRITTPSGTAGTAGTAGGATTAAGTTAIAGNTDPAGIDIFSFGANASQILWDFGQNRQRFRAANRLALSAEATEKQTTIDVVANVRRGYFAARAQRALVTVANDTLTNLQLHLAQIQGFVEAGTRPEIDLAQAKTDVANARVSLIDAENAYSIAKVQLAIAIGDDSGRDFEVADDELGPVDVEGQPNERVFARAVANRPDLMAIERQKEGQALTASSLRGGYWPTLTASAGASEVGTSLGSLSPAWNVGAALTWPLFQGGITRAQVREAEANVDAATAQLDNQRLQIRLLVQQAILNLRSAKTAQSAADEAVTNATERLRLAEGRYAQGVGSAIELGDAQVALTQARAQAVQARYRISSARADLLAATGQR